MDHYDRRTVTAPEWLEHFRCIAGECSETCCQQWNIEVDPLHADCYTHLGDPELQPVVDRVLRRFRVRRPGMRSAEMQYLLQLLNQPQQRCPLLNESGECSLQKKYGAYILCDTCYFHPRTFFQIDDRTYLSACLSCPECARLALLHREPTVFSQFEAEIDSDYEWLETSMMTVRNARVLMQNRDKMVQSLCAILQSREHPITDRLAGAVRFLNKLAENEQFEIEMVQNPAGVWDDLEIVKTIFPGPEELMTCWLEVFDPISETHEKPVREMAEFTRSLAGGNEGYVELLTNNYLEGAQLMEPFLSENEHLVENFMVHCVFSDSFKQFFRCQNEALSAQDILHHEAALLQVWYLLIRVQLAFAALSAHSMNEKLFLQTLIRADRTYWHYPDWFARIADRYLHFMHRLI